MSQYDLDITVESKARMEGSWGATGWTTVELNITAHANMDTLRGWFEIHDPKTGGNEWYAEGGLWFNQDGELTDYDGVGNLDSRIRKWIENGFDEERLVE